MATYTVTFQLGDGYRTGGGELTQQIQSGEYAVAPTCEREGCVLRGWDKPLGPIYEDTEITALWIEFTTLYYSADGATNVPETVSNIEAGSVVYVSTVKPKKLTNLSYDGNGCKFNYPDTPNDLYTKTESLDAEFLGWHTSGKRASEGLVEYYPGDPITMWGNVTLYAVYGKTRVVRLPEVGTGEFDLTPTPGYVLDKWTTTRNGTVTVAVGDLVNENSTIYAKWKKVVTFNATSGKIVIGSSEVSTTTIDVPSDSSTFTVPSYTMKGVNGSDFLGWATSTGATTGQYQAGDSVLITSSMTLYAIWKTATFTVTWVSEGNTIRIDRNVPYGTSLTPPNVTPSDSGQQLVGWLGDYTYVTSDMTVVALWDTVVVWYRSASGSWVPYKPKEDN